jgi:hypothetical protein
VLHAGSCWVYLQINRPDTTAANCNNSLQFELPGSRRLLLRALQLLYATLPAMPLILIIVVLLILAGGGGYYMGPGVGYYGGGGLSLVLVIVLLYLLLGRRGRL